VPDSRHPDHHGCGSSSFDARHSTRCLFFPALPIRLYTTHDAVYIEAQLPGHLAAAMPPLCARSRRTGRLVALLMLMRWPWAAHRGQNSFAPHSMLGVLGWVAGASGLAFSVLHLGQPRRAWRVFLGLRKSWLSREAVTFGAWFPLATTYMAVRLNWLPLASGPLRSSSPSARRRWAFSAVFAR